MSGEWTPKAPVATGSRPRGQRLSAEEVRGRMLRQGMEVIRARGLIVGLDDVRMEDLIVGAQVPRSSVWRIWPGKWEYLVDLLVSAADPHGADLLRSPIDDATLDLALATVRSRPELLSTPQGRRTVLAETVRVALSHNYAVFAGSTSWRTYMAMLATVNAISDEDARARIASRLHEAERAGFLGAMAAFYREVCTLIGLRLRAPDYTFEHLALTGAALVEGLALRNAILDADSQYGPGPDEPSLDALLHAPLTPPAGVSGEAWSTAALAFLGVLDAFTEPDPDADVSAA